MISRLILLLMFECTSQQSTPVLKGIFVCCETCPGCDIWQMWNEVAFFILDFSCPLSLSYRFIPKQQQPGIPDTNRDLLPSAPAVWMMRSPLCPSHLHQLLCKSMSECFLPLLCCLHPITSLPPSLPVYSLLLWPPPLCCATPSPLDWASASLVSGVVVVDSARDDSTAWTGSQLHMRRALHGPTAKSWSRTQMYPAECSGASGMRTTMLLEVRASHDKILWMFTTTQLTVLTSFWGWFQLVSY